MSTAVAAKTGRTDPVCVIGLPPPKTEARRPAGGGGTTTGGGPASGRFLRLRHMGRNGAHQWRRQAIIGLESEFLQTPAYAFHLLRLHAGLDDGRHERREPRRCPTTFLEQFGVGRVQAVERMARVLDAAVHMRAAALAGVALNRCGRIDNLELVAVFEHGHVLPRYDGDDGEDRALGLPALGAAAGVVMGDIVLDPRLARLVPAFADQGAAGKAARASLYAVVNRGVDVNSHASILLVYESLGLVDDNRAYRPAFVHQVEPLVDLLELEDMRNHRVDLNLSGHVPVDDLRHVGAAACASEGGPLPHAAGHELERPGGNFLAGFGDPDDHRDAPAAMTAFQRLTHHRRIAGAIEGVVGAAVGQGDER